MENNRLFVYWALIIGGICAFCAFILFFLKSDNWIINATAWGTACGSFAAFGYCECRNQKEKIFSPAVMWLMRCDLLFVLAFAAENVGWNFLAFILFCLCFIVLWFLIIHVVARWRQRP